MILANQLPAPPNKTKHALQMDRLPIKPIFSLSQGLRINPKIIATYFHGTKLNDYKVYNLLSQLEFQLFSYQNRNNQG